MDLASQNVVAALEALSTVPGQLRSFGYALYLETKPRSWRQPDSFMFFKIGKRDAPPENALGVGFGIQLDATGERWIAFSVDVSWNANHWTVRSTVDAEDYTRADTTEKIWTSPEYESATLEELIDSLQKSIDALIASAHDQRVASVLASVERRP